MYKKIAITYGLSVLLLCFASGLTVAQQTSKDKVKDMQQKTDQKMAGSNSSLSTSDREFVAKAAAGGHMEVMLAEMAVSKATNAEVKQFAQRLLDDHSKANEELKSLAASKNITLPTEDATKSQKMKTDMEKHSDAAFDREYMKGMVKDHQKDIAMFEREAREGRDTELKAWADKTLPTLREHLQMAQEVAGKIGASGMGMSTKGQKDMKEANKPPRK